MVMWKSWLAVLAAISSGAAAQEVPRVAISVRGSSFPSTIAFASANLAVTGRTIPLNFIGFSTENQDLINGYFQGTTGNAASYIGVASLLGANGYLRIGGGSADFATPPALTSGIASNLAAFVAGLGAGWKVLYTLDAVANNSATAATQAGLLATALGSSNVVFQYGNEPITSGHFNNSTYTTMWNAYQTAVAAAVPGVLVAAPDDGMQAGNGTQTSLSGLSVPVSGLTFMTLHAYEYGAPTTLTNPAIPLSNWQYVTKYLVANVTPWANVTAMRIDEGNMISNKGQAGMTDRLMHSAYTAMKAADLAKMGWAGYDPHSFYGAPIGNYNTLVQQGDGGFSPGASFYGLYLFSKMLGQQIVGSSAVGNIYTIATQRAAGKANLLVINLDTNNPTTVTASQSSAWSTANVLQVKSGTGAGCSDSSITVGGQAIAEGGAWSGSAFSISNGQTITLGPCETALISVQ